MPKLNLVKKQLSKEDKKIFIQDPSQLLADFFNGVVIKPNEQYYY